MTVSELTEAKKYAKELVEALATQLTAALGRIKSLEDTAVRMDARITELEKENQEMQGKIDTTGTNVDPAVLWSKMVESNEVKNGISNLVSVEKNQAQRKLKNLLIFEKRDNHPKLVNGATKEEVVKGEVKKILTAIGKQDICDRVKSMRFKQDGPILMVFEEMDDRMEVLKASGRLRNKYAGVYINADRTMAEAANEKILKEKMKALNGQLREGADGLKYEVKVSGEKTFKWWWGVRDGELRRIFKEMT
jgi:hypothetical protein